MAVDPCTEYNVLLALEDFVPVVLAGVGCVLLAEVAGRSLPPTRVVARLGGLLIVLGGLSKATWKLLVAGPCVDVPLLEQALFPLLATGFMLLSWSLLSVLRGRVVPWWSFALVLGIAVVAALGVGGTAPLLVVAALGAVAVATYGFLLARRAEDPVAAALFVVYAVATLVLPPLAAKPEQTLAAQWAEQLTNSVAQGAFAFASWRLLTHLRTSSLVIPTRTVEAHP